MILAHAAQRFQGPKGARNGGTPPMLKTRREVPPIFWRPAPPVDEMRDGDAVPCSARDIVLFSPRAKPENRRTRNSDLGLVPLRHARHH
jgi:hypothetical protein